MGMGVHNIYYCSDRVVLIELQLQGLSAGDGGDCGKD